MTVAIPKPIGARRVVTIRAIAVFAELFPGTFVAEQWAPHRPLAVGIHHELIALGLVTKVEAHDIMRSYVMRLQYQRSLAAGGPRFGFDGKPCGGVTAEQVEGARKMVERIEAKIAARFEAARQAQQTKRPPRVWRVDPPEPPGRRSSSPSDRAPDRADRNMQPRAEPNPQPLPEPAPSQQPKRLSSLADLKQAARERRGIAAPTEGNG
jgi:sRNA-binding protein